MSSEPTDYRKAYHAKEALTFRVFNEAAKATASASALEQGHTHLDLRIECDRALAKSLLQREAGRNCGALVLEPPGTIRRIEGLDVLADEVIRVERPCAVLLQRHVVRTSRVPDTTLPNDAVDRYRVALLQGDDDALWNTLREEAENVAPLPDGAALVTSEMDAPLSRWLAEAIAKAMQLPLFDCTDRTPRRVTSRRLAPELPRWLDVPAPGERPFGVSAQERDRALRITVNGNALAVRLAMGLFFAPMVAGVLVLATQGFLASAIVVPLILILAFGRYERLMLTEDAVTATTTLLGLGLGRPRSVSWQEVLRVDVYRLPNRAWLVDFVGRSSRAALSTNEAGAAWIRSRAVEWAREHARGLATATEEHRHG